MASAIASFKSQLERIQWHVRQLSHLCIVTPLIQALDLTYETQQRLYDVVLDDELVRKYPVRRKYVISFAKRVVDAAEERGFEIYERFLKVIVEGLDRGAACEDEASGLRMEEAAREEFYLHYSTNEEEKGSNAVISTRVILPVKQVGTVPWEAGFALADFAMAHKEIFEGKKILDLGAGTGLLGFVAAIHCKAERVVMSDYEASVLENLEHNLIVNMEENRLVAEKISVQRIDWEKEETYPVEEYDLITCADCLYDPLVIPHLVRLVKHMLKVHKAAKTIVATTLRNMETFRLFRECVEKEKVAVKEIQFRPAASHFFSGSCSAMLLPMYHRSEIKLHLVTL